MLLYNIEFLNYNNPMYFMHLVEVGSDFAVFEVQVSHFYAAETIWNLVASPFNSPRYRTPFVLL